MIKNALLIFVRNPQLGKVKTRLAKSIGNEKALHIYNQLLLHTAQETKNLSCDVFVFYDLFIDNNDIWQHSNYIKKLQIEGNLGQKMLNAFETVLNLNYKNCIIIGSDLFDLKKSHIENAFTALECNDFVVGPALDGGYYLLGLKKMEQAVFQNKNWGTETVLKDTLASLLQYKVHQLEVLNDIDTIEDLNSCLTYKNKYEKM